MSRRLDAIADLDVLLQRERRLLFAGFFHGFHSFLLRASIAQNLIQASQARSHGRIYLVKNWTFENLLRKTQLTSFRLTCGISLCICRSPTGQAVLGKTAFLAGKAKLPAHGFDALILQRRKLGVVGGGEMFPTQSRCCGQIISTQPLILAPDFLFGQAQQRSLNAAALALRNARATGAATGKLEATQSEWAINLEILDPEASKPAKLAAPS